MSARNVIDTVRTDAKILGDANHTQSFRDAWVTLAARSSLSVKQFGAVGDDSTDDTAAIQDAIDAVAALPYGGTVYVPPGRYMVNIKLRSRVALIGANEGTILKGLPGVNEPVVSLFNDQVKHTTLANLWIDGNKSNNSGADCDGVKYVNDTELTGVGLYPDIGDPQHRIYNVVVTKCLHHGMDLFCRETHVSNCLITHCDNSGILVQGSDNWFASNSINWVGNKGFNVTGGSNLLIQNKVWYNGQVATFAAADAFEINSAGNLLVGCNAQDTSRHGFRFLANGNIGVGLVCDGIGAQFPIRGAGFEHDEGTGSQVSAIMFDGAGASGSRCRVSGVIRNRHHPAKTLDHACRMNGTGQIDNFVDLTILDTDPREAMFVIANPNGNNIVRINGRAPIEASLTATELADVADAINTTGKYRGKIVWEETNDRVYAASGPNAADPWYLVANDIGAVTPS